MVDIEALWDFSDPEASEKRFREAILECTNELEEAEVRTQIARTFSLRKRFEECAAELDFAEQLMSPKSTRARVRLLLERGRRLNSSGHADESVAWFQQAVDMAAELDEVGLEIDAIHMLAIADITNALSWNLKAIAKAESVTDARATRWRASLYNNVGWTYFDSGDTKTALAYFETAVPFREEMGNAENLAVAKWSVARTLRELGRTEEALAIVEALLTASPEDRFNNQEVALCLTALGRPNDAKAYAKKAWEGHQDDPWFLENRAQIMAELEQLIKG